VSCFLDRSPLLPSGKHLVQENLHKSKSNFLRSYGSHTNILLRKRVKSKAIISDSDDENTVATTGKKKTGVKQLYILIIFCLLFILHIDSIDDKAEEALSDELESSDNDNENGGHEDVFTESDLEVLERYRKRGLIFTIVSLLYYFSRLFSNN
jgi:hypothetical protein